MKQQILVSGLGGQGIVLISRVISEAALVLSMPVISSETHGMAQRGGTVVSHIKIGPFISPLIKTGCADVIFALKEESLPPFAHFLREGGFIILNSPNDGGGRIINVDADFIASDTNNPKAVNLALLGFAFSKRARERGLRLFCTYNDIEGVIKSRFSHKKELLKNALATLSRARDAE